MGDPGHPHEMHLAAAPSAHQQDEPTSLWLVAPGQHVLQFGEVVSVLRRVNLGGKQRDALGGELAGGLSPGPMHCPLDPGFIAARVRGCNGNRTGSPIEASPARIDCRRSGSSVFSAR